MRLNRRPLCFALLLALASGQAHATDLMQAYQLARESDPQLGAAEANRNAQQEGVVQSRSALLPQVNAEASRTESRSDADGTQFFGSVPNSSDTSSSSTNTSLGLSLRQSVYDHANYTRLGASKARASQADAQLDAANDALALRVAEAYFNALTAIQNLASSRAEETAVKRQLDLAEKRLEVGLAPITDVHEARARYDISRANTITSANALDDAYEALAEIIGRPAEDLRGLSDGYQPKNTETRGSEEWVKTALDTNPTLRSFEQALAAAEKDVATARAGHLPSLSANGSWRDSNTDGDNTNNLAPPPNTSPFENGSRGTSIGITLSIPLFSGFATQSRVRQALYQRDAAAEQLEQQKRAITRTTRNAYRSLQAGEAEVEARRLAVVSAKAAYEAGEAGLEVGTRTIVDVLTAQQQLFQAERDYARARHNFLVNQLRLKQAAGTLEAADLEAVNRVLTESASAKLESR